MRSTLMIETGLCGFGWHSGLFPGVRLGVVQMTWCRGSLETRIQGWLTDLKAAADLMRGPK